MVQRVCVWAFKWIFGDLDATPTVLTISRREKDHR
jgi:hypothetical protein